MTPRQMFAGQRCRGCHAAAVRTYRPDTASPGGWVGECAGCGGLRVLAPARPLPRAVRSQRPERVIPRDPLPDSVPLDIDTIAQGRKANP